MPPALPGGCGLAVGTGWPLHATQVPVRVGLALSGELLLQTR